MNGALATTRSGGAPALSDRLAKALEAPQEWRSGTGGFEPFEGAWLPPATVPEPLKAEAQAALPAARAAAAPAPRPAVVAWLAQLGVLCAGQTSAADAKVKVQAFASLVDHPACCFTRESLERAGRQFKWLPSYAELAEFLDREARPIRDRLFRLEKLAAAKTAEPDAKGPLLNTLPRPEIESRFAKLRYALSTTVPAVTINPESKSPTGYTPAQREIMERAKREAEAEAAQTPPPPTPSPPPPPAPTPTPPPSS